MLEKVSKEKMPRAAVHHVLKNNLNGLEHCSGVGQVPRNRQQASDLKRNRNGTQLLSGLHKRMSSDARRDDPWYLLFTSSKRDSKCRKTAFVRDVRVGGEPLCVLASDRQLNDLKRFCCNPREFKPLTVDPTFNIGRFNVTPISYQHLTLETKRDGKYPTFLGPILIHEKKTEETYSTFCASLKSLEPGLCNLMAFGTDDEKALENAFNNNFERAIQLLCELHLRKTVERKLLELGVNGKIKDDFISDVFGRTIGNVFKTGLSDARSKEEFDSCLKSLGEKWKNSHARGSDFYQWFLKNKADAFVPCVICPVRERAGLGSPPEKFTTNRSERTNGIIQEFVARECGKGKVDEHTFAVTMRKLVGLQEKEAEFSVLGKGEHKLREKFSYLFVSAARWSKMTEKQKQMALSKIHIVGLEEARPDNTAAISSALEEQRNVYHRIFIEAQVDWLPRDVLTTITAKVIALEESVHPLPGAEIETVIVPSKSNPKKPHIVVCSPNGKCECQDCPSYSASFICAHAIAASAKMNRLDLYLKWLVTTKRKTGGVINFSKAIVHGMPTGRGKKPNEAPRKRSKTKHNSGGDFTVLSRRTLEHEKAASPQLVQHQTLQLTQRSFVPQTLVGQPLDLCIQHHVQASQQQCHSSTTSDSSSFSSILPTQLPLENHMSVNNFPLPAFPSAQPGMFLIYLLHYCPPQTSVCFGCRTSLKPGGIIGNPPHDLVIVSNMERQWIKDGLVHNRPSNVYFHCLPACVALKQVYFRPTQCVIPNQIAKLLVHDHWRFLQASFGNLAIA